MNRRNVWLAILSLALASPGLAADEESPYLVDKRDFKKTYKIIALMPVDSAPIIELPESAAKLLEAEITRHLEKRGYTVIPSADLAAIRETMSGQVGGLVDPASGEEDPEKRRAVREHSLRELWFQREFDAVAKLYVSATKVRFADDRIEWDGAKAKLEKKGRNRGYEGTVYASSVSFEVYDQSERLLYVKYGGIEPLQWRDGAQLIPIAPEKLFSEEKTIKKAAQIAMKPI